MLRTQCQLCLAFAALLAFVPRAGAQAPPGPDEQGAMWAGDVIATKGRAGASIALGDGRLSLAPASELRIASLTPACLTASLVRGELFLDLADLPGGVSVILRTPRGDVVMEAAGAYEIAAGDGAAPAVVAVLEGAATAAGTQIVAGREAVMLGGDPVRIALQPVRRDAFADQMLASRAPRPMGAAPQKPVAEEPSLADPRLEDPDRRGAWAPEAAHGPFWSPGEGAGWVPFAPGQSFTTITQGDGGLNITRYTNLAGPQMPPPAAANTPFAEPNKIHGFQAGASQ
jgi:hypothetical protein